MYPIYTFRKRRAEDEISSKLAKGEMMGCFGLTGFDFGKQSGRNDYERKKVDGGYLINGAKMDYKRNSCRCCSSLGKT